MQPSLGAVQIVVIVYANSSSSVLELFRLAGGKEEKKTPSTLGLINAAFTPKTPRIVLHLFVGQVARASFPASCETTSDGYIRCKTPRCTVAPVATEGR
ncbi:50S ribosomal protein L15 [Anopheles sinensis]|uniref:50S ribosomal protein L15 n=1 Tax=Anopheles sinensis TaxID=74873 RepID=A0A084VUU0_ANOSI|nr:50S ribosomal protein L15 [Anopheles sinensis]